jgi:hypothetical protein
MWSGHSELVQESSFAGRKIISRSEMSTFSIVSGAVLFVLISLREMIPHAEE